MFRSTDLVQDLKQDILELKRELTGAKEDNLLLKVKIRKLQHEVSKRDRQIETLIDPRKFPYIKKVISEKGASMLVNLKEQNIQLERNLVEKDSLIKRLQNDLQTKRLYSAKSTDRKKQPSRPTDVTKCNISMPYYEHDKDLNSEKEDDVKSVEHSLKSISMLDFNENRERSRFRSASSKSSVKRAVSADRSQFNRLNSNRIQEMNDMKIQYEGLSRDHLLSIIESLKSNRPIFSPRTQTGGSPESDLERNELQCDTPHQEIHQLQNYFMDMLTEVDLLKSTIFSLHTEQRKTTDLLKQKDGNIMHLAKEIEGLKRSKSEIRSRMHKMKCSSSISLKRTALAAKRYTKSAPKAKLHVEKEADEELLNDCTYTETDELKPQSNEHDTQIVHTRTISVQKFEDPSNYVCLQRKSSEVTESKKLQSIDDALEPPSCDDEQQKRRETFNNLMKQMLQKTNTITTTDV